MACSTKALKIFAILWDLIYAILGLLMLSLGIYVLIKFEHFDVTAFVIIGLGLSVTLIAAFGCLGACRESSRLSKIFAVLLFVFIVIQVLSIGFFWIFKSALLDNMDKTFDQLWHQQPVPIKPGEKGNQIGSLERLLECCGNTGPSDYLLPPFSCYNNDKLNLDGCRQKFLDFISDRWNELNIFILVLVVVECICGYFAYVLANSILNRWRRSKYYSK